MPDIIFFLADFGTDSGTALVEKGSQSVTPFALSLLSQYSDTELVMLRQD